MKGHREGSLLETCHVYKRRFLFLISILKGWSCKPLCPKFFLHCCFGCVILVISLKKKYSFNVLSTSGKYEQLWHIHSFIRKIISSKFYCSVPVYILKDYNHYCLQSFISFENQSEIKNVIGFLKYLRICIYFGIWSQFLK